MVSPIVRQHSRLGLRERPVILPGESGELRDEVGELAEVDMTAGHLGGPDGGEHEGELRNVRHLPDQCGQRRARIGARCSMRSEDERKAEMGRVR